MIPFIITSNDEGRVITLVLNNKPYTINEEHLNFKPIWEELKGDQDPDVLIELVDVVSSLKNYLQNSDLLEFDLNRYLITYKGERVHSFLATKILEMFEEGFKVDPLINFMKNLYNNPSPRAIDELYTFIEYGQLPITEDGCFLAYKRVNADYTSIHDKKTDNSIGAIVEMSRDQVDHDSHQTCSSGLHLCSFEYLKHFDGDRVVILKVNPRDVVSVPVDYSNTKARACRYEVVGEVTDELKTNNKPILPTSLATPNVYRSIYEEPTWAKPVWAQQQADLSETADKVITALFTKTARYGKDSITLVSSDGNNVYSPFFKAAYQIGYVSGKERDEFDDEDAVYGDSVCISNGEEYIINSAEAQSINDGYAQGYKDGKAHRRRLVPKFRYADIVKV